jgi:CRISPR-associated RAMP protein (TIGR02581 family)
VIAPVLRIRHHACLEKIVLFHYRLTCRTGLHIGAGKSADLVGSDLPVMRDASGRPLVPGSSLRGVLRAGIESFCESLGLNQSFRAAAESEDLPAELVAGWNALKVTERLFGAAAERRDGFSYGSRLQISDCLCHQAVVVELRDGVGINRETRTAAQAVKFDLEVVPAGTRFLGQIRFKNPEGYELGLLAQALWMLDAGLLLLGGKSSRGLGWVQVEVSAAQEIEAREILERKMRPVSTPEPDFGPIEDRLGAYLRDLEDFAERVTGRASSPAEEGR